MKKVVLVTAIGTAAQATHNNSVALGYHAKTTAQNQIVLGGRGQYVTVGDGAKWDFDKFVKNMFFSYSGKIAKINSILDTE